MVPKSLWCAALGLLQAGSVLAQKPQTCSLGNKCPKEAPCCSQYGECGVGAYCLGGCDPRMSFSLDSCVPAPVCKDRKIKMNSLDRVVDISKYYGDASKADWVSQGEPLVYRDNILLTMPPHSVGTVLSSTVNMWYGSVKAKLKTARGRGVVTAFILMSDVKDEIDYEWVGANLETTQTNYYFQGIPDYTQSSNISVPNTYDEFHEYEIQWTPDEIKWVVDGKVGRTKKRADTWNETSHQWDFPQTPSRVQISIWPGGAPSNAEGTIAWAGGEIDWDSDEIKKFGYYFATFSEIEIKCYDAPSPPGTNKGNSYWYTDSRATNDTVQDGDKPTVLKSLAGTGLDMDKEDKKDSNDKGGSNDDADSSNEHQIPGGGSSGNSGATSKDRGDGSQDSNGNDGSDANCNADDFNQSCNSDNQKPDSSAVPQTSRLGASGLAIVGAIVALFWL